MEDRIIELEALQKALLEGIGYYLYNYIFELFLDKYSSYVKTLKISACYFFAAAYDKLQGNILKSKENLNKIFTSKDVKATVSEICLFFRK